MDQLRRWAVVPVVAVLAMVGVSAAMGAFSGATGAFPEPLGSADCPAGRLAVSDSGLQGPGLGTAAPVEQAAKIWADDATLGFVHPGAQPVTAFADDSTAVVAFTTADTTVAQVTFRFDPDEGWRLTAQQVCAP